MTHTGLPNSSLQDPSSDRSLDRLSDGELMDRYFALADHPEQNAAELAAIDAAIQARLRSTYGAAEPGTSPRVRIAA